MWPFRRASTQSRAFRAVAYLKPEIPEDDPAPVIQISGEDAPVLRNLGNGLVIAYVVDTGSAFEYIQQRDLMCADLTPDRLHSIAIANLSSIADIARIIPYSNIFAVLAEGNFEASFVLVERLWESTFRQFVADDYAVAIPARDVLAFCKASSDEGIAELQGVIDRCRNANCDHPISDRIFVRTNGGWKPL